MAGLLAFTTAWRASCRDFPTPPNSPLTIRPAPGLHSARGARRRRAT